MRTTRERSRATQPKEEYDPDGRLIIGGNRGFDDHRGAANATSFEACIKQVLVPILQAGQIVVLDNLQMHKVVRVRQLIESKGRQLLFLPAYSPDLSPIEETFAKLKACLRRAKGAKARMTLPRFSGIWKRRMRTL